MAGPPVFLVSDFGSRLGADLVCGHPRPVRPGRTVPLSRATTAVALAIGIALFRRILADRADRQHEKSMMPTADPGAPQDADTPKAFKDAHLQRFLTNDRKFRIFASIVIQLFLWLQPFGATRSPAFALAAIVPWCIGISVAIFGLIQGKAKIWDIRDDILILRLCFRLSWPHFRFYTGTMDQFPIFLIT